MMNMKHVEHTLERLRLATENSRMLSWIIRIHKVCNHQRPGTRECGEKATIVLHLEAYCYECAKHELVDG